MNQLTWFDRQGKPSGMVGQPGPNRGVALSRDGTRAAVRDAATDAIGDIWTVDFERGVRTRLTFRQSTGSYPIWSPDGSRIAFAAGNNLDSIFEKPSSGATDERKLFEKVGSLNSPSDWSSDGRFLLFYTANSLKTGADIWLLPMDGPEGAAREPVLLLGTQFNEFLGSFSPDLRWIVYFR
jgi:Tol biopolymer transport system component